MLQKTLLSKISRYYSPKLQIFYKFDFRSFVNLAPGEYLCRRVQNWMKNNTDHVTETISGFFLPLQSATWGPSRNCSTPLDPPPFLEVVVEVLRLLRPLERDRSFLLRSCQDWWSRWAQFCRPSEANGSNEWQCFDSVAIK